MNKMMPRPFLGLISNKFKSVFDRQMALTLFFGLALAAINLVITLDLMATLVIIILFIALAIFSRSFSRGWLFLLGVSLLFPAVRIGESVFLFDLFLFVLVIVSLAQFAFENNQFFIDKISFNFFLFLLVGISLIIFSYIFNGSVYKPIWSIFISFLLIWLLLFVFQYFFQTRKRIQRFLILISSAGTAHSLFGIITFLGVWQTSSGTGIIIGRSGQAVFDGIKRQISGFFGSGLEGTVGHNFLASFLVVSILSTLGLLLHFSKKFSQKNSRMKKNSKIYLAMLLAVLTFQFIGIILTFSYSSLLSLGLGALIIGIIIKNNKVVISAASLVIILTVVIPRIFPFFSVSALGNFENVNKIFNHWILGNGIIFEKTKSDTISGSIFNSYLFIWNYYGILGLGVLLSMFYKFFIDIYLSYKKAQGQERLLLTVVAGIFIALLMEGFSGNILIFGPTSVVFWLFYAIVLNLKNNLIPISFIIKSGLFSNTLGFFIGGGNRGIDGIKKRFDNRVLRKR